MTVKIREWKKNMQTGFEVDIRFTYPDGTPFRRRMKAPVESKSAAKRWGEAREAVFLREPSPSDRPQQETKETLTLNEFGPRFIDNYARANRQKASGVASKESVLRIHLYPRMGKRRLDAITDEDVQALKSALSVKSPKTVNNVLTVLSKLLKVAVKWKVMKTMPCAIELLKVPAPLPKFYEFSQYRGLVEAAEKVDTQALVVALLGGDAGLRRGEMIGLRWVDVDFRRKQLVIQQAVWKGIVDTPKSGKGRVVPMTDALFTALQRQRHLCGERVLYRRDDDGKPVPFTEKILRSHLAGAQRRAGLPSTGALHILRHTFCSHLAMRGAPAKAIQELAGHEDLTTTLRYMHLSPAAREGAIKLLNRREDPADFGDIVETEVTTG